MPTERFGKVRRLLKNSLAHVVCRIPFTIQLDYDTTDYTQPVSLGVDAGSKHIGISVTTSDSRYIYNQGLHTTELEWNLSSKEVNEFRVSLSYRDSSQ